MYEQEPVQLAAHEAIDGSVCAPRGVLSHAPFLGVEDAVQCWTIVLPLKVAHCKSAVHVPFLSPFHNT